MRALRSGAASWACTAQTKRDDYRYVRDLRRAYPAAVGQWINQVGGKRGVVWANITRLLSIFAVDISEIAFTNLAKCVAPVGANTDKPAIECDQRFPILDLVDRIEPLTVIVLKDSSKTRRFIHIKPSSALLPLVRRCGNRTGLSGRLAIDAWAPGLARTYWIFRLRRALANRLQNATRIHSANAPTRV
jgi:hypothetical protein